MKRKMFAIGLAAVLLLAGCGGGGNSNSAANGAASAPTSEDQMFWDMAMGEGGYEYYEPQASMEPGMGDSSVYQNPRAKLIRRAELNIQTEQFDQSLEALNQLVASCGGYFETANLYGGGRRDAYSSRSGDYKIRIPAEKYDQFLSSTGDLGYVTNKYESSEDVGERYYDAEARLKTQRTKQDRLLALLEKAESMEDIIVLENALSDVEYQIEQYSSELNRYDALISYATFQVSLNEVGRVTQEVGETASLWARMAAGFQASFRNLGQGLQDFLVWMSYNIFLLVILAVVAAVAVLVGRRELKKLKRQSEAEEKSDQ